MKQFKNITSKPLSIRLTHLLYATINPGETKLVNLTRQSVIPEGLVIPTSKDTLAPATPVAPVVVEEPVVETPKPVAETPKPVAETPKPVVDTPEPVVETKVEEPKKRTRRSKKD